MNLANYETVVETDIATNAKVAPVEISNLLGIVTLLQIDELLSVKDSVYNEYVIIAYRPPITLNAQVELNPKKETLGDSGLRLSQDIIVRIPIKTLDDRAINVNMDDVVVFKGIEYSINEIIFEGFYKNKWAELVISAVKC